MAGVAILLCVTVYLIVAYRRRQANLKSLPLKGFPYFLQNGRDSRQLAGDFTLPAGELTDNPTLQAHVREAVYRTLGFAFFNWGECAS